MLLLSSPLCATTLFFTLLFSSLHSSTKFFSVVPFHIDATPLLLFVEGSCTTPLDSLLQELGVVGS
jgi:hypothetical protein